MTGRRVVVWLAEGTWRSTVDAAAGMAPADAEIVLLHVIDADVEEALRGACAGLLGRGTRGGRDREARGGRDRDPGRAVRHLAEAAGRELLDAAERRLGRPARREVRTGRVEREVVEACEGAALLVCARDGDRSRLGPRSLGHHTRFAVDHAPCAVLLVWPDEVPGLASIPPPPQRR